MSRARLCASPFGTLQYFSTCSTCCVALSDGNRLKPWKMKPQWSSRNLSIFDFFFFQRSSPSARTEPSSGFIRPDRAAIRVDLPEPDGPMTMVTWP